MEERKERCIRCEKMRVGDLKHGFGNPRKITKKKAEELERSLEMFGDFGIFLIDENDNVIAGNQRSHRRLQRLSHILHQRAKPWPEADSLLPAC